MTRMQTHGFLRLLLIFDMQLSENCSTVLSDTLEEKPPNYNNNIRPIDTVHH